MEVLNSKRRSQDSREHERLRALRETCPSVELFLVRTFLYSERTEENTNQKKLRIWTLFTQWSFTAIVSIFYLLITLANFSILDVCRCLVMLLIQIGFPPETAEAPVLHQSKLKRCHQCNETRALVCFFDF